MLFCQVELEACAIAVWERAHRGREGNPVSTLIRPNGWCKVAKGCAPRHRTVDKAAKKEMEKDKEENYC